MSQKTDNPLNLMINKLSLNQNIEKKANEIIRLIKLKSLTNSLVNTLTETARLILCLDIASSELNLEFNKDKAIQLAGLKPRAYNQHLQLFKKTLGYESKLTIRDICVRADCSTIQNNCELLLNKYKEHDKMRERDFDHPQYACMAVYITCRLNKIKVQKSHFLEWSHLKNSQWLQLEAEFSKFIEKIGLKNSKNKAQDENILNTNKALIGEKPDNKANENLNSLPNSEETVESYETWKARMMEFARKT